MSLGDTSMVTRNVTPPEGMMSLLRGFWLWRTTSAMTDDVFFYQPINTISGQRELDNSHLTKKQKKCHKAVIVIVWGCTPVDVRCMTKR